MADHDKVPFKEFWNSEDYEEVPWELLEEYDDSAPTSKRIIF
jgi:hypothetical protein